MNGEDNQTDTAIAIILWPFKLPLHRAAANENRVGMILDDIELRVILDAGAHCENEEVSIRHFNAAPSSTSLPI